MNVACGICGKLFKEINNAHLNTHNLSIAEYDTQYPNFPRMSTEQRATKRRYQNLTPEMSAKLRFSQTLEGFVHKYGDVEGKQRWVLACERKSKSKSLENFIRKFGQKEGMEKYNNWVNMNAHKMTRLHFIEKYGDAGADKYESFVSNNKKSNSKEYYTEKYGVDEGTRRWSDKANRNSISSMKVPPEQQSLYKLYKTVVLRYTRETLRTSSIEDIGLVEKGKYALDHKFSILEGFRNNVPPHIIATRSNLEVLPHSHNSSKQEKCSMSLDELCDIYFNN